MATTEKKPGTRDKDVPWYTENVEAISDEARELLENYSKIPAEKVNAHILKVRDLAWDIWPYPCIGRLRFLDLSLPQTSLYPSILQRLKNGQTLLDLGCCFGQEIRKLVSDGAPSANLYGTDLQADFLRLGYELFLDRGSLESRFIAADILKDDDDEEEEEGEGLRELEGKIDIVYAGSFFHLFDLPHQLRIAKRIVGFFNPRSRDAMILGRQIGYDAAVEKESSTSPNGRVFRHDVASLKKMWETVGEETGTSWEVEATLEEFPQGGTEPWVPKDAKILKYVVRRG
ncbi:MAG: hypothetical protein M1836_006909 [Candelina mexicana]|nr:MAG: hypothetical protein M1836_006909 [Candelina mexicana]